MVLNKSTVGKKNNGVSVTLKKQAILGVCMDALKQWREQTDFGPCNVSFLNGLENPALKLWIDEGFMKTALIGLLETAARRAELREGITFSLDSKGLSFCRMTIIYSRKMTVANPENDIENIHISGKFLEIVSQHRGKIEVAEETVKGMLLIKIPC